MKKIALIIVLFVMVSKVQAQKIYGGTFSRSIPTGSLRGQPFVYAFDCRFYTDVAARTALPTQLKFKIFRKKDNMLVQEFMADKQARVDSSTVVNNCIVPGSTPKVVYQVVQYTHERIINPADYNDPGGYYVVNEGVEPRNQTANIASSIVVLYHWFSPKYLFEQPDNGDDGRLVSRWGSPNAYVYGCINGVGVINPWVSMQPAQTIVNGATFRLTLKSSIPLTDGSSSYQAVNYNAGFSASQTGLGTVSFLNASPTWQNTTASQVNNGAFTTSTVYWQPVIVGTYSTAFLAEHYRNGEKIAENSCEFQVESNECKYTPNYVPFISEVGNTNKKVSATVCRGNNVQLNGDLGITDLETDYQWYKDDKAIVGANRATLTVSESGRYNIVFKKKGTCNTAVSSYLNPLFIDCQTKGPPSILGNSMYSFNTSGAGRDTKWWNRLNLRSEYYIPIADLPKMPQVVKASLYRKRDHLKLDELTLLRSPGSEKIVFLPRACGTGVDTVQTVGYDSFLTLDSLKYAATPEGYYALAEPVCCRAQNDNLTPDNTNVVTMAEFNGANQVLHEAILGKDLLLVVGVPAKIDACLGQEMNFAFNVTNRQNLAAKLVSAVEILTDQNGKPAFKDVAWKAGFSTTNFANNQPPFQIVQEGNRFVIKGVPAKTGIYILCAG